MRFYKFFLFLLGAVLSVKASPFLSYSQGVSCQSCHSNPVGGGILNPEGKHKSNQKLPLKFLQNQFPQDPLFDGKISDFITLGGNFQIEELRKPSVKYLQIDSNQTDSLVTHSKKLPAQRKTQLRYSDLFIRFDIIPGSTFFYLENDFSNGNLNEAWALIYSSKIPLFLKIGQIRQPYGIGLPNQGNFNESLLDNKEGKMAIEMGLSSPSFKFLFQSNQDNLTLQSYYFSSIAGAGFHLSWLTKDLPFIPNFDRALKAGVSGHISYTPVTLYTQIDLVHTPKGLPTLQGNNASNNSSALSSPSNTSSDLSLVYKDKQDLITYTALELQIIQGLLLPISYEVFWPNIKSPLSITGKDRLSLGLKTYLSSTFCLGVSYQINRAIIDKPSENQDQFTGYLKLNF